MRHVPNLLTTLRIVLIPIFLILMSDTKLGSVNAAIVVFIIASLTDYADGFIARRWGVVSDLGKLLDPIADKILVTAALVMLVAQKNEVNGAPWVPGWMVVLILAREIWVTGLRAVAASEGRVIAASSAGKWKSLLQMAAIVALLCHDNFYIYIGKYQVTTQHAGLNLLMLSILVSYWGGVEYTFEILGAKPREAKAVGS